MSGLLSIATDHSVWTCVNDNWAREYIGEFVREKKFTCVCAARL